MFTKNLLVDVQTVLENPALRFACMFLGIVPIPLIVFAVAIHDFGIVQQPSLIWSFLAIAVFLSIGLFGGFWQFRHKKAPLSILALSLRARRQRK